MFPIVAEIEAAVSAGLDLVPLIQKAAQTFAPGAPPATAEDLQAMKDLEAKARAGVASLFPADGV